MASFNFKNSEAYTRYYQGQPGQGTQLGRIIRLDGLPIWEKNDVSNMTLCRIDPGLIPT